MGANRIAVAGVDACKKKRFERYHNRRTSPMLDTKLCCLSSAAICTLAALAPSAHAQWEKEFGSYNAPFRSFDTQATLHGSAIYQENFYQDVQYSDLQLVTQGAGNTAGTWDSGIREQIQNFTASFNFSFNSNGGNVNDGFSFLIGNMSDLSGDRAIGNEQGLTAFNQDGAGISIGFDAYGPDNETGFFMNWGGQKISWTDAPNTSHFTNGAGYSDYLAALAGGAKATIEWDINTGMSMLVEWANGQGQWSHSTGLFSWGEGNLDTTDWGFGFAARNGGVTSDVLIDNFEVDYGYLTQVPAPGAFALLALGGLAARRRRG
ncbi:MAG: hypothetical protein CMJ57_06940 [Planctomycetaceae bacterium]|nr:hypothetical protein [Planctomycetaceae bacterium]